jgi:hypothetical protein
VNSNIKINGKTENMHNHQNGIIKIKGNCGANFCENLLDIIQSELNNNALVGGRIIVETCDKCNCRKFVPWKQYDLGKQMAYNLRYKGIRIGIYTKCDFFNHLIETVAINRGLQIKVSKSEEEIYNWI